MAGDAGARERAPGLCRRRDAGQDASGTYRNITRDVSPPPEIVSGVRSVLKNPWRVVLGCLASSSSKTNGGRSDPPLRVKMLDTIVMEATGGGHPEDFFFTGTDGWVQRKAERFLRQSSDGFRV